jgi:methionine synthase II (cobalamin-independent)
LSLRKTVVGSFPRLPFEIDQAIRAVIDLQLHAGMDIVSDGEQRADMITYFEDIPGLSRCAKGLAVNSKISAPQNPLEVAKVKDFITAKDYLRRLGREGIFLKTAVTGPVTLGFTCATAGLKHYSGLLDERLYIDLSEALEPVITTLLNLGSYVQIDEPGLSAGYIDPSLVMPILRGLFSHVSTKRRFAGSVSIHVCGGLGRSHKIMKGLLELDVDVLSLAFSGPTERSNLDLISESLLEGSGKRLGVGCTPVSITEKEAVEDARDICLRIKKICDKVGRRNVAYAHPDCGLRGTSLEVSELILQRFSEGVDRYNQI